MSLNTPEHRRTDSSRALEHIEIHRDAILITQSAQPTASELDDSMFSVDLSSRKPLSEIDVKMVQHGAGGSILHKSSVLRTNLTQMEHTQQQTPSSSPHSTRKHIAPRASTPTTPVTPTNHKIRVYARDAASPTAQRGIDTSKQTFAASTIPLSATEQRHLVALTPDHRFSDHTSAPAYEINVQQQGQGAYHNKQDLHKKSLKITSPVSKCAPKSLAAVMNNSASRRTLSNKENWTPSHVSNSTPSRGVLNYDALEAAVVEAATPPHSASRPHSAGQALPASLAKDADPEAQNSEPVIFNEPLLDLDQMDMFEQAPSVHVSTLTEDYADVESIDEPADIEDHRELSSPRELHIVEDNASRVPHSEPASPIIESIQLEEPVSPEIERVSLENPIGPVTERTSIEKPSNSVIRHELGNESTTYEVTPTHAEATPISVAPASSTAMSAPGNDSTRSPSKPAIASLRATPVVRTTKAAQARIQLAHNPQTMPKMPSWGPRRDSVLGHGRTSSLRQNTFATPRVTSNGSTASASSSDDEGKKEVFIPHSKPRPMSMAFPTPPPPPKGKAPTKSTFVLPGEIVAAKLKAAREERDKKDDTIKVFKARPVPASIKNAPSVRQTNTSRARESIGGRESSLRMRSDPLVHQRASSAAGFHGTENTAPSARPTSRDKMSNPKETTHDRPSTSLANISKPRSASPVAKTLSASTSGMSKGREVFTRDVFANAAAEREKRAKEEAQRKARAEAAERSRQLSREWAEKKRREALAKTQATA